MIQIAISLESAGQVGVFRSLLRQRVIDMIEFKLGSPPPTAEIYRSRVMRLYGLSGGARRQTITCTVLLAERRLDQS